MEERNNDSSSSNSNSNNNNNPIEKQISNSHSIRKNDITANKAERIDRRNHVNDTTSSTADISVAAVTTTTTTTTTTTSTSTTIPIAAASSSSSCRRRRTSSSSSSSSSSLRWIILMLICIVMASVAYSYDIPAALHQQLRDGNMKLDEFHFNLLYTVYSIPNIVLPFFGGTLVDQVGASNCLPIFCLLCVLGQIIVTFGSLKTNTTILLFGRFVYGLGAESLYVSCSTLLSEWFGGSSSSGGGDGDADEESNKRQEESESQGQEESEGQGQGQGQGQEGQKGQGQELALAFGLSTALCKCGSVLNNWISPVVANQQTTTTALGVGVLVNGTGLLLTMIIFAISEYKQKALLEEAEEEDANKARSATVPIGIHHEDMTLSSLMEPLLPQEEGQDNSLRSTFMSQESNNNNHHHCDNTTLTTSDHLFTTTATIENNNMDNNNDGDDNNNNNDDNNNDSKNSYFLLSQGLSPMFWLLSLSCLVVYGCVMPFNNVASAILLERNYFRIPPPTFDCTTLLYPHQCTTIGKYQDHSNPTIHVNTNGTIICHVDPKLFYAPVLPILPIQIIMNGTGNDDNDNDNDKNILNYSIVNCDIPFWSQDCTKEYCDQLQEATERAGRVMSIPYMASAILSPLLGGIVDQIGQRALLALVAPMVLLMVHLDLALVFSSPSSSLPSSPIFPLIGQGVAYAVFGAVLWPSIPLTVTTPGIAFGIINSIQNIGLVVFPMIVAAVHKASHDTYIPNVEYIFCACAAMGILVGIQLNRMDRLHGNKLNSIDGKGDRKNTTATANNNNNPNNAGNNANNNAADTGGDCGCTEQGSNTIAVLESG